MTTPNPDTHPLEYITHVITKFDCHVRRSHYGALPPELQELVPLVEQVDLKILTKINTGKGALDMGDWHEGHFSLSAIEIRDEPVATLRELEDAQCGTTHCRAGWAIHLAGVRGYALEAALSAPIAAKLIYQKAYPGRDVPNFWESDAEGLRSLEEGAQLDLQEAPNEDVP